MPPSIHGRPTRRRREFTDSRASRLSSRPTTTCAPAKPAQPHVAQDVSHQGHRLDPRPKTAHGGGGHLGLEAALVGLAEQHRPAQVARFDAIHVDDRQLPHSQQGQVLQHLVAQGAGADDQHAHRAEPLLVPPVDAAEPREAVFHQRQRSGGQGTHRRRLPRPAVISGWSRSSSP